MSQLLFVGSLVVVLAVLVVLRAKKKGRKRNTRWMPDIRRVCS